MRINRRVLSLWFPRLGAERLLRQDRGYLDAPFAVVDDVGQMQILSSLSVQASEAGLRRDQPLRDALAMCPQLLTRSRDAHAEAQFLTILRRWGEKFSPWVAEEGRAGLTIDLTGCTHLFGGEDTLMQQVQEDCEDLRLSVRMGIADTKGAAWALARYAGASVAPHRSGDAIDQEAHATRARAVKRRHWERGGAAPKFVAPGNEAGRIAAPGDTRAAIAPLPIAALRLPDAVVASLARVGLRRIAELMKQPRAGLARRYGREVVLRLDQAIGAAPEPVSPGKPPLHFACRLSLPDPIGLIGDMEAAIDKMLPRLSQSLQDKARGIRRLRLEAHRVDQSMESFEIGLARPSADPERIRPLLVMKLEKIDAGYGIDMLRLEAIHTEPVSPLQHKGQIEAGREAVEKLTAKSNGLDDLVGKIGARIGLERITRLAPSDSHIPEKTAQVLAAAWSEPQLEWPAPPVPRPLTLWPQEPVSAPDVARVPLEFRWRGQDHKTAHAQGPERIAPEWWLDDHNWRSGTRDYWRITTARGAQLWLFYAHGFRGGGVVSSGWFCQGSFA